jgi:superfamily II DNA/RNA helicase
VLVDRLQHCKDSEEFQALVFVKTKKAAETLREILTKRQAELGKECSEFIVFSSMIRGVEG